MTSSITRLVLAIKSVETDETLERWQFDVQQEDPSNPSSAASTQPPSTQTKSGKKKEKTEKEVQAEIREIMKQITSTTTFLPILDEECESAVATLFQPNTAVRTWSILDRTDTDVIGTFTLLAYTNDSDVAIPATWDDADPHLIDRGKVEQVRLRSFSTNVHSLEVGLP
jgi:mitotic spindle assembly checkpoint protein MAD2